jgi:hypothetical protein
LKAVSDANIAVRLITAIEISESSFTFFSLKTFNGVITIVIPSASNRRGIQNVRVLPDPVGAKVNRSLRASCANAASSCQVHGVKPNHSFTTSCI